jgi:DNA-binding XRE family transcriptional regulator
MKEEIKINKDNLDLIYTKFPFLIKEDVKDIFIIDNPTSSPGNGEYCVTYYTGKHVVIDEYLYFSLINRFGKVDPSLINYVDKISNTELLVDLYDGDRFLYDILQNDLKPISYIDLETNDGARKMLIERIKSLMIKNCLNNEALAEKLNVSPSTVTRYLRGSRTPSLKVLQKMALIFGCSIDDLFYNF